MDRDDSQKDPLIDYLVASSGLGRGTVRRIIDDVLAHYGDSLEEYVVRRHQELAAEGWRNPRIFLCIQEEVGRRRFRVKGCTIRQIRRMIYG